MILIIGTIVWATLVRYLFNQGTDWNFGAASRIFFVYILLGAAYVLLVKSHVSVDILYKRFSPRTRSIVDLITFIAFIVFVVAMLWEAVVKATIQVQLLHPSPRLLLPPYWPVLLVAPVGIFLFLLQGLAKFIRDIIIAITGKEAP